MPKLLTRPSPPPPLGSGATSGSGAASREKSPKDEMREMLDKLTAKN